MLDNASSYQIAWMILGTATFIMLFFTYSSSSKNKVLIKDIERKKNALAEKPVEQIVVGLKQDTEEIERKIEVGTPIFLQLKTELRTKKEKLRFIDVGLLPPTFKFDDSESLKKKVASCMEKQYQLIKSGKATCAYSEWSWFGSKSKGAQMVTAYQSLLLKAFNAEFDMIRKQMRHSSYDTAIKKLVRLEEQLRKLGETANVSISYEYFALKEQELTIWHGELKHKEEMKIKKKQQQALLRAQAKQSNGDTEELEDNIYYKKSDLLKAQKLAKDLHGASAVDMEQKIGNMKKEIQQLEAKFERATSQAQLTKAGYIYVISNIGSFGEGVVKIGMTRRLEPMDRVNELGDASVPFKFDVHTLTFVDDAPKIEKMLHHKFNDVRVNIDNPRKEFFRVSPQEVAEALEDLGIDCDWYFDVEAKEYRESLLIREAKSKAVANEAAVSSQLPESI